MCTTVDQFLPPPFRATPPPLYCAIDASPSPFWAEGGRLYGDLWGIQGRRLRVKPNQEKTDRVTLAFLLLRHQKKSPVGPVDSWPRTEGGLCSQGDNGGYLSQLGGRRCLEERRERRSREGGVYKFYSLHRYLFPGLSRSACATILRFLPPRPRSRRRHDTISFQGN